MGSSPRSAENRLHATPAWAPVILTQTVLCFSEAPTVLGNSPGTGTGVPIRVRWLGFVGEMRSMERVLEAAFMAKMN
jgi:hypothetical protein